MIKKTYQVLIPLLITIFVSGDVSCLYAEQSERPIKVLAINREYDKKTVIKPSQIPNAGNGLFALVKIARGEVIGELGGELISDDNYPKNTSYLASIPECAQDKTYPYKYLDSREHGANVSRINFAPSKINDIETGFQNAYIEQLCDAPYFIFLALDDIEPGTEIWSSYGDYYNYSSFMYSNEIMDFFCSLLMIDCLERFKYEP